jgi:2-polyprenyl-3-methyl-5-hydroxy-6-metoxy-1,4-benzoquinol methylase
MIDSRKKMERFLQNYRFRMVKNLIKGDVMDFGGNEGELKKYVKGHYFLVNYDHSVMDNAEADTITILAVIEHITLVEVHEIFKKFKTILRPGGKILITTPTLAADPVLRFLAKLGFLDKKNIEEHAHYWSRAEIEELARQNGFTLEKYKRFQFGFNQFAIFVHQ